MSKGDVSGRLSGYYRDTKLPAYLKVEEDRVSWHEGGRKTLDRINIEYGDFQLAESIVREVTGIQNYNCKLTYFEPYYDVKMGIVSSDGEILHFLNILDNNSVDNFTRITEEEARELGEIRFTIVLRVLFTFITN